MVVGAAHGGGKKSKKRGIEGRRSQTGRDSILRARGAIAQRFPVEHDTPMVKAIRIHAELFGLLARGVLMVKVTATYRLREASQAHRDIEARRVAGAVILQP